MAEDSAAALDYLVNTRHIPVAAIVPYGQGLGAVIAANLANTHSELPAVIIDDPDPDAFTRAIGGRSRMLPIHLLVRGHFDIAAALATSVTPKLLLADGPFGDDDPARVRVNQELFRSVPDPKITVTFAYYRAGEPFPAPAPEAYLQTLRRFLDEYAPR